MDDFGQKVVGVVTIEQNKFMFQRKVEDDEHFDSPSFIIVWEFNINSKIVQTAASIIWSVGLTGLFVESKEVFKSDHNLTFIMLCLVNLGHSFTLLTPNWPAWSTTWWPQSWHPFPSCLTLDVSHIDWVRGWEMVVGFLCCWILLHWGSSLMQRKEGNCSAFLSDWVGFCLQLWFVSD